MGTETRKAELEPCVIPKPGSDCYKVIQWAMKDGGSPWTHFWGLRHQLKNMGTKIYIYIYMGISCHKDFLNR